MSGGLHVHVGGGVERRTAYHEEQAAIREALESGTASTVVSGRAVLLTVVALPAASVDVHEDAPNYGRPKTVCESKKKASERKRTKAMREWQRGAHLPGAVEAVETAEDESSDGGGGGVAPALPGRKQSALSASFLQQAAAEGAAVAAGTPPGRMLNLHGVELSSSLRYLRRRLREYLGVCAANDVAVTMYDVGGGDFYPTEQWTVHFFKWMRRAQVRGGRAPAHKSLRAALGTLGAGR